MALEGHGTVAEDQRKGNEQATEDKWNATARQRKVKRKGSEKPKGNGAKSRKVAQGQKKVVEGQKGG